jgi:probable phosphoglycerate mutase
MNLLLVRHGKPARESINAGDPPLCDEGREQARRVARQLAAERVQRIVHSPLQRAVETAAATAAQLDIPAETLEGLAEADAGSAIYRSVEDLRKLEASEWQAFMRDPVAFLGGDPVGFRRAVLGAFESILGDRRHQKVAVFTHGLPINLMLSHALKLEGITHFVPHFCSITRLSGDTLDTLQVVSVNETLHGFAEAA